MSLTSHLDGFQRRHPGAGFPIAVVYKYFDDSGGYLAALITYYGFLSLFPLLLLGSTILGLVLSGDPHAQQAVLHSALRQFPVIGSQLHEPGRLGGGLTGILVGSLGALYGGTGVAMAAQNAMNIAGPCRRTTGRTPSRRGSGRCCCSPPSGWPCSARPCCPLWAAAPDRSASDCGSEPWSRRCS
jgi:membrane protein